MHEISLTRSLLDIVEAKVAEEGFRRVRSLKLSLGRLSCAQPAALEFAFAVQSRGTVAEGAALSFEMQPIRVYCFSCERESLQESFESRCPGCGAAEVVLVGGAEELRLLELDVE